MIRPSVVIRLQPEPAAHLSAVELDRELEFARAVPDVPGAGGAAFRFNALLAAGRRVGCVGTVCRAGGRPLRVRQAELLRCL